MMANTVATPISHNSLQLPLSRRIVARLAVNVTQARLRAGLTQHALAEAAELSRATVHLIEAGACDPRLSTISSLATALGIDTLVLLGEQKEHSPPA